MKTSYNLSFACFVCRKSFKRKIESPLRKFDYKVCPNCGGKAFNLGRHFKAPKINDKKQWEKVKYLFDHGFRFQKIRPVKNCIESIPYPETLEEAKEFVIKYKEFSWPKTQCT
jgi:DNA-directed RNA polymerase subunit RPC12/RpoP